MSVIFPPIRRLGALALMLLAGLPLSAQLYVSVGLSQPAALSADAGPSQLICPGDSIAIGGATAVTGGTTPYSVAWSPSSGLSSPTAASTMASPSVTTTYTLNVTDAMGCTALDSATVAVDTCVSIFDAHSRVSLDLFPNPTKGGVIVSFMAPEVVEHADLLVHDAAGRQVLTHRFDRVANAEHRLDLGSQPRGTYLVTLRIGDRSYSRRLLLQ